jgi:hypothetical protein
MDFAQTPTGASSSTPITLPRRAIGIGCRTVRVGPRVFPTERNLADTWSHQMAELW